MKTKQHKTALLQVKLTPEEHNLIHKAAELEERTASSYVRSLVLKPAKERVEQAERT